jgi:hypothetical protein
MSQKVFRLLPWLQSISNMCYDYNWNYWLLLSLRLESNGLLVYILYCHNTRKTIKKTSFWSDRTSQVDWLDIGGLFIVKITNQVWTLIYVWSIFVHISVHSFRMCYAQFGVYANYIQINVFVNSTYECFQRKKGAQTGTNVSGHVFHAGLLARSHFASGRSCDRPTQIRFSAVPEQMLSWHRNSTLHCMLDMQPSQR